MPGEDRSKDEGMESLSMHSARQDRVWGNVFSKKMGDLMSEIQEDQDKVDAVIARLVKYLREECGEDGVDGETLVRREYPPEHPVIQALDRIK